MIKLNEKKELIIQSFVKLYRISKNYETISLKAIANEAGIGKSTIYEYFSNKDDLISQALVYTFEKATTNVLVEENSELNFEESLRVLMKSLLFKSEEVEFIFSIQNIDIISVVSKDVKSQMINKVMNFKELVRERFNAIFLKGIAEGVVDAKLLLNNHFMINSLVFGSIRVFQMNYETIDVDQFITDVVDSVLLIANKK